jgi:flagellar motor switch protein FliN/FliY
MTASTDKKSPSSHGASENTVHGRESAPAAAAGNMDFILDIPLEVTIELGRTKLLIHELLKLGQGSVIELSKLAGETLEVLANQKLIARGEVVVINEKYGVRLTEVVSPMERIERLG